MPPTTIHSAPALDSFTTLADHQSQTPTSFYGAKPVLHYHGIGVRALISQDQVSKLPIFTSSREGSPEAASKIEIVDAFVSSENLTLFNKTTSTGVSIPYPAISLHAIQRLADPANSTNEVQGLYMQLELSDPYGVTDEDEPEIVELTLIPATAGEGVKELFEAVSNCSNLHPDPTYEDEEMEDADGHSRIVFEGSVGYEGISGLPGVQRGATDGGLPPPFPGSGGWITAENVSDFFDANGNWIADEGGNGENLGEGAGRVRTREELEGDGLNGHSEYDDEAKRSRTD
ncbi:hypothetical protein NA56DRAFT_586495 [Hyaloscypha hepaticicola]|uniref:Benzoylformate decarboxylase n=1 Tax=Hyaloscypha hepaticicola TaxID=2082293 RepID=A0A2J6PFQ7_9HELO|nr:hypothetical protein NA56DRAFT_586495 [Hyaloscypha hepaticicola]